MLELNAIFLEVTTNNYSENKQTQNSFLPTTKVII